MSSSRHLYWSIGVILIAALTSLSADDVITLKSAPDEIEVIAADEPIAAQFSATRAAAYLDRAALAWQKNKKCATCHTNMPYLFARPALSGHLQDSGEVRRFFEEYPTVRWKERRPTEQRGF